jgi:hypothetical protein
MVALKSLVAPAALLLLSTVGQAAELSPQQRAFREIYQELVEINTTDSVGDTAKAAEAMAARLRTAGLPMAGLLLGST